MEVSRTRFRWAVIAAGVWMNLSEFARNELLLKHYWVDGFRAIGLAFPSAPVNGAVWVLWSFIFVTFLSWLVVALDVLRGTIISWVFGFVLLWIALGNVGVLPSQILYWAVPWSLVEVYIAASISRRIICGAA